MFSHREAILGLGFLETALMSESRSRQPIRRCYRWLQGPIAPCMLAL